MSSLVLGFTGHARSGKTSIAAAVAQRTGLRVASFGREVERIARERELPLTPADVRRETLIAVGAELVATDVADFCRRVLSEGGWAPGRSVLVEGVRHAVVNEWLRAAVAPATYRLILVAAPAAVRETRLAFDGIVGADARAQLDAHSTEREIGGGLSALASLVVDGAGSADNSADRIVATMEDWGWRP